ncbi:MAG: hypothetical protein LBU41_05170, partial [Clostridiales Family XIII bacterium]|nr:hypothetical protein [Clostridiales Family XIII bacterium]
TVSDFLIAYNTGADVVAFAFESAVAQKGSFHIRSVKNLLTILDRAGVKTEEEAEICLSEYDMRGGWHMEIKKALGIPNNLTEEERRIFDQWLDDYGLTIDDILHKAKQTAGKNNKFAYLKTILDSDAEKSGKVITKQSGKPSRKKFYETRRKKAEAAAEKKRKELYAVLPEVREIDEDITRLSLELSLTKISGADNRKTVIRDISKSLSDRLKQRENVLMAGGFDANYTDIQYACPHCNDTGVLDNGTTCSCFEF